MSNVTGKRPPKFRRRTNTTPDETSEKRRGKKEEIRYRTKRKRELSVKSFKKGETKKKKEVRDLQPLRTRGTTRKEGRESRNL